eukprot:3635350-Rhodomonas_salina.2
MLCTTPGANTSRAASRAHAKRASTAKPAYSVRDARGSKVEVVWNVRTAGSEVSTMAATISSLVPARRVPSAMWTFSGANAGASRWEHAWRAIRVELSNTS